MRKGKQQKSKPFLKRYYMNGATTLSELIADEINSGKYRTMSLEEFESWCDEKKKLSLPVKMVKKVWIAFKSFVIKLRKLIFKF